MAEPVIQMDKVTKSYGNHKAVNNLSLTVSKGQILGLLGPNGAGKTTTIRLLNGVINPDQGKIAVLGYDPIKDGEQVRSRSGVLTESAGLYEGMNAEDNLQFFATLYGVNNPEQRIKTLLADFGLASAKDKKVGAYSTGMKKRLGIARALLHKPDLLFLDEPTNGLDPEGARDLIEYITNLNKSYGVTVLICTHLLKQVQDLCHRFVFIDQGSFLEEGSLKQLEQKHLRAVKVAVETNLAVKEDNYKSYPIVSRSPGELVFHLSNKEQVPNLLRDVLDDAPIYSVNILGRDLESLYFKIRGEK